MDLIKAKRLANRIGMPVEERDNHPPPKAPFLKRPFDIILALTGFIAASWLCALFGIMIIIEDGFPILIRQDRVGKNGRPFKSIKFRSMIKSTLRDNVTHQARENDPRITRVGRALRRVAMDELPQLINILIGDMSFVGPRALLPKEIEVKRLTTYVLHLSDIPGYEERVRVQPGLTGIAQIYAARDLPRRYKFKYDLLYLRRLSFWTDLKLIMLSFIISFHGTWERRGAKLRSLERKA
jgi:lipopolysaccharide/colanic/teichoic acid biosynthesis glycosyltransferase